MPGAVLNSLHLRNKDSVYRMELSGKRILLISPQPWDGLHMSKHHLAQALVARGNTVVFLDPPTSSTRSVSIRREGKVHVATYRHWFRGINHMPRALHMWYYKRLIRQLGAATGGGFDVLWCFDTSRMQWFPKGMGYPLLHLADIDILHQGSGLLKEAELILTVSDAIQAKALTFVGRGHVVDIGHALDERWLEHAKQVAGNKPSGPRRVAYAGQMQWNYVDWGAIRAIALDHADLDFDFYGPYRKDHPDEDLQTVLGLPNTHFHGLVSKEELIPALHAADILLLCYRDDLSEDQCSNSHKLLEYLSTGNVVVSSNIRAYRKHKDLLVMTTKGEDIRAFFSHAVEHFHVLEAPSYRERRIAFARDHGYTRMLERVEKLIEHG